MNPVLTFIDKLTSDHPDCRANASHRAFVLRTEPLSGVSALRASIAFAEALAAGRAWRERHVGWSARDHRLAAFMASIPTGSLVSFAAGVWLFLFQASPEVALLAAWHIWWGIAG